VKKVSPDSGCNKRIRFRVNSGHFREKDMKFSLDFPARFYMFHLLSAILLWTVAQSPDRRELTVAEGFRRR
jgi:hypothetical protein